MDRRDFLGNLAALGALGISMEASGTAKVGRAIEALSCREKKSSTRTGLDDNLVCILSDLHVHPDWHQERFLADIVDRILALSPRPKYVFCLGDIAYLTGKPEEYAAAKRHLDKLEEAGMQLTLTMGNHDRRSTFAEAFPTHAAASLLPDRYVYKVETPRADFILLDSLQQGSDTKTWITEGALNDAQVEWLEAQLSSRTDGKPVFVMAHHPLDELKSIRKPMLMCPSCRGYIYGHKHVWNPGWIHLNFRDREMLRTLCVPSTGHWGDIGFVTLALEEDRAVASVHELDFFFPGPCGDGEAKPALWEEIAKEHQGARCVFPFA